MIRQDLALLALPFAPTAKNIPWKSCSSKSQVKVAAKLNWHHDSIDLLVGQVSRDVLSLPADRQRACVNPTKHTVYAIVTPLCSQMYHIHHLNAFHCYASPHRNEFRKIYHIANFRRQHEKNVPHKYILYWAQRGTRQMLISCSSVDIISNLWMDSEVCLHWLRFLSGFDPTVKPLDEWAKSDRFNNMLDWHRLLTDKELF